MGGKQLNIRKTALLVILIAASVFSACFLGTGKTNVRGTVKFEGKPVVGAEVRFSGPMGQDVTRTDFDGRYSLTVGHKQNQTLELKVLWPGYTHDEIKFPAYKSTERIVDIELKKVFTPAPNNAEARTN
ncbi:MAG: hypothetical protein ACRD6X_07135 [Pyrinomonadaceae bacterium]